MTTIKKNIIDSPFAKMRNNRLNEKEFKLTDKIKNNFEIKKFYTIANQKHKGR